jgi:hypothetical protein
MIKANLPYAEKDPKSKTQQHQAVKKAMMQIQAKTAGNRRPRTIEPPWGMSRLGGDQHPLLLSLLTSEQAVKKAMMQIQTKTTGNRKPRTIEPPRGISRLGGDQHPLLLSLLTSEAKGKKLLLDDWLDD